MGETLEPSKVEPVKFSSITHQFYDAEQAICVLKQVAPTLAKKLQEGLEMYKDPVLAIHYSRGVRIVPVSVCEGTTFDVEHVTCWRSSEPGDIWGDRKEGKGSSGGWAIKSDNPDCGTIYNEMDALQGIFPFIAVSD